jgi:ribosomal protein S18 acetylase RimI-like enzyme
MHTGDSRNQQRSGGKKSEVEEDHNTHSPKEENDSRPKRLELEIREIEVDDIPEVFHLGEQIFTVDRVPTLYRTWDEYEVTSLFNSDPEFCLVAEIGHLIVGFALGTTVTKTRSSWKYGYLVWLGVLPEWQRDGVGGRLFDRLAEKMIEDGVRMFLVDTEADNTPALQFFRKKGFTNPEEHIYLTLNLKAYRQMRRKTRGAARKHQNGNHP